MSDRWDLKVSAELTLLMYYFWIYIYMCVHTEHHRWEFSPLANGSWNQIQVMRLGNSCFCLLSHHVDPSAVIY